MITGDVQVNSAQADRVVRAPMVTSEATHAPVRPRGFMPYYLHVVHRADSLARSTTGAVLVGNERERMDPFEQRMDEESHYRGRHSD